MRKFFRKFLIYLLAFGMLCPAWLATGVLKATHAKAFDSGVKTGAIFDNDNGNGGDYAWSNVSGARLSDDGQRAWVKIDSSSETNLHQTHYLKATRFGFDIPDGTKIEGIEMRVEKHQSCAENWCSSNVTDDTVKLLNNGVVVGSNLADKTTPWSTTDKTVTYGSSTDLWGGEWTASDINNDEFGAVFSAKRDSRNDQYASVDQIAIKVYYSNTPPAIVLNVGDEISIEKGTTFVDPGATATDLEDGILTDEIRVYGSVNEDVVGTYTLLYSVNDEAGNVVTATRKVHVIDTTEPIITITKNPDAELSNQSYTVTIDYGADALLKFYQVNNGGFQPYTAPLTFSANGVYEISAEGYDQSGNVGKSTTSFTINTTPPVAPAISYSVTDKTIKLTWNSVEGAVKYHVYLKNKTNGAVILDDTAASVDAPVVEYQNNVASYGEYYAVVTAEDALGNISAIPAQADQTIVKVIAPAPAVVTTTPTPAPVVETPAPAIGPAKAQAAAPVENKVETPADDSNGQIKGDDTKDEEDDKTNWTPWIVLFVLIILAGAATGGYFYWFNGEEEVKTVVRETKKEEVKKDNVVKTGKKSNNQKKQKRW